ncbi:MAG: Uma2 family endonuclease [Actinomycetota bacterium]
MARPPQKRLTYDDYAAFPDDGIRRELIHGEVYELTPAPTVRHQRILGRLHVALYSWVSASGRGEVLVSPVDVLLSRHDVVQPDIVYVDDSGSGTLTEANIQGVPTLAIEIVSDPRHDRVRKLNLYANAGIPVYVIVDPDDDRVEGYRHTGRGYGPPAIFRPGDVLTLNQPPGFSIDVAELLRR